MSNSSDDRIFNEAKTGYGFEEVEQRPEGIYCAGCLSIHKRPTKMYRDGVRRELWCKQSIIRYWNPEEC